MNKSQAIRDHLTTMIAENWRTASYVDENPYLEVLLEAVVALECIVKYTEKDSLSFLRAQATIDSIYDSLKPDIE